MKGLHDVCCGVSVAIADPESHKTENQMGNGCEAYKSIGKWAMMYNRRCKHVYAIYICGMYDK